MGRPAAVSYRFQRLPSTYRYFPRAVFGRRATLVPEGRSVPRLEAAVESVRARNSHLARYRNVCGFQNDGALPITYPHVLAMPLHVALLTHPKFIVRLMGLVHVGNEIHENRKLPESASYRIRTWIEGHRDGDRGHEFDLYTEFDDAQGIAWHEKCTLLARRTAGRGQAARSARQTLRYEKPAENDAPAYENFEAPRAVGRRYGWLSGDLNPIHLGDRGARLFGFECAVAHGMWSMARSLATLGAATLAPPVRVHVEFKLPLFLPSTVRLEHWPRNGRHVFVLKDAEGQRPHLAGSTRPG
ncbi:MAG: MaoC/PaaZ C-terminal domain-containing protein [Gammaproteobacteria bacterium]